jgi:hypothetical protein
MSDARKSWGAPMATDRERADIDALEWLSANVVEKPGWDETVGKLRDFILSQRAAAVERIASWLADEAGKAHDVEVRRVLRDVAERLRAEVRECGGNGK